MNRINTREMKMNRFRITQWYLVAALAIIGATVGWNQLSAAQAETDRQNGMQVLTRGPVHEAFAETSDFRSRAGHRGAQRRRRTPSKKCRRTSGRRGPTSRGSPATGAGTTSGTISCGSAASGERCRLVANGCPGIGARPARLSMDVRLLGRCQASEVQYLPEPPATVETGPNIAAPSADDTWLPGCWVWQQNRYAWRPGFWARGSQIGIGFPPITFGPLAAMSSSMATGIIRSAVAACCLRRSI